MKTTKILLILLSLVAIQGCNRKQKQLEDANQRIEEIKKLVRQDELSAAKTAIDSVHLLYPTLIEVRKQAAELKDEIKITENKRVLLHADSVLKIKNYSLDSLERFFVFEKDSNINRVGVYTHKNQLIENNLQRTYMKATVSEKGELTLTGIYFNKRPLHYTSLKVTTPNALIKETIHGNGASYTQQIFQDNGFVREMVSFNQTAEDGICRFIAENENVPVKVTLQGKYLYSYQIYPADKKAIIDTYHLFLILNDIIQLNLEQKKAHHILNQIDRR